MRIYQSQHHITSQHSCNHNLQMADTLNVFISFESCQCFYNLIFSFLVIHSDYRGREEEGMVVLWHRYETVGKWKTSVHFLPFWSHVCDDKIRYFKSKQDINLTLSKLFFHAWNKLKDRISFSVYVVWRNIWYTLVIALHIMHAEKVQCY